MKFRIDLKDPSAISNAVDSAVTESVRNITPEEEKEAIFGIRVEKIWDFLDSFVHDSEYVTLEVDTMLKTIRVVNQEND